MGQLEPGIRLLGRAVLVTAIRDTQGRGSELDRASAWQFLCADTEAHYALLELWCEAAGRDVRRTIEWAREARHG